MKTAGLNPSECGICLSLDSNQKGAHIFRNKIQITFELFDASETSTLPFQFNYMFSMCALSTYIANLYCPFLLNQELKLLV